jgi:hypothetical protein
MTCCCGFWCSRPWLCYWIIHSIALLGESIDDELEDNTVDFLNRCQVSFIFHITLHIMINEWMKAYNPEKSVVVFFIFEFNCYTRVLFRRHLIIS